MFVLFLLIMRIFGYICLNYQAINTLGYVICSFLSWVLILFELKFVLVSRYQRDMKFRIQFFFGWLLFAFLYLLFPYVWIQMKFYWCIKQFDCTSVGLGYMLCFVLIRRPMVGLVDQPSGGGGDVHAHDSKVHGAHLGPTGPKWIPYWPHELCYLGRFVSF